MRIGDPDHVDMKMDVNCVKVDGDYLYVAKASSRSQLEKFLISTGSLERKFEGLTNSVAVIHLLNDMIFAGNFGSAVACWDKHTGVLLQTYSGHTGSIGALATIDNNLYSADSNRIIIQWNISDGQILNIFPMYHANSIRCLVAREDFLYSGADDSVAIKWNTTSNLPIIRYKGRERMVRTIVPWSDYIVGGGNEAQIKFWDVSIDNVDPFKVLTGHRLGIVSLFIIENALYSGSSDKTIRQWDLIDFVLIRIFTGETILLYSNRLTTRSH